MVEARVEGLHTLDVWVVEGYAGILLKKVLVLLHASGCEAQVPDGCNQADTDVLPEMYTWAGSKAVGTGRQ